MEATFWKQPLYSLLEAVQLWTEMGSVCGFVAVAVYTISVVEAGMGWVIK